MAREAPGGREVAPSSPPTAERQSARKSLRPRVVTLGYSLNVPVDLYEELKAFSRETDLPMSEIMNEGARRELARLRKLHNL